MQAVPYLNFNGNCKTAMQFYQSCFGGELQVQTLGASLLSETLPEEMKDLVVQASLVNKHFRLFGTDLIGDNRLLRGTNMSICVLLRSLREMNAIVKKLSFEAIVPSTVSMDGHEVRTFKDQYGVEWIFYCALKGKKPI